MMLFNSVLMLIALSNPLHPQTHLNSQISSADDSLKTIEKVYLHVDRDTYYPGDDLWFKAYLFKKQALSSGNT